MPGVNRVNVVKNIINKGQTKELSQFQKKVQILEKEFLNHCDLFQGGSKANSFNKIG